MAFSTYLTRTATSTFLVLLGAGCGGKCPPAQQADTKPKASQQASKPPPPPERTAAETKQMHGLLYGVAAKESCGRLHGSYSGLGAPNDPNVVAGRLRIEQCKDERDGDQIKLDFSGRGWRWIDKESEKLGATFKVSEYAKLSADIQIPAKLDVAYAPQKHVITLWLTPTEQVEAKVQPLGELNAKAEGAWGDLLGTGARIFATAPDEKATKKLDKKGDRQFSQKLNNGYTVAVDLCTGQRYKEMGRLKEGELPDVPYPSEDRLWLGNERVRVYEAGVDLAGPYDTKEQLKIDIELEEGGSLQAQLVCASDAALVADAFIAGKDLPQIKNRDRALVVAGKPRTLEMDTSECSGVLMTQPGPSAKDSVTFRYMAYRPGAKQEELVKCPDN